MTTFRYVTLNKFQYLQFFGGFRQSIFLHHLFGLHSIPNFQATLNNNILVAVNKEGVKRNKAKKRNFYYIFVETSGVVLVYFYTTRGSCDILMQYYIILLYNQQLSNLFLILLKMCAARYFRGTPSASLTTKWQEVVRVIIF